MRMRLIILAVTLAAAAAGQSSGPVIGPAIGRFTMTTNQAFSQQFTCSGACGTSGLTWDISAGTIPTGLTMTNTGLLSGTPTVNNQSGEFVVRLRAQSIVSVGLFTVATRVYAYQVNPQPVFLTANPLAPVTSGTSFSRTISANIAGLWRVSGSTLPAGVTVTTPPNGGTSMSISGVFPVVAERQVYSFQVALTRLGEEFPSATTTYIIAVNPPITAGGTLAAGSVGVPYNGSLGIQGGTPPYSIVLASASLPPGLVLNSQTGELSGTPTTQGSYGFSIRVSDQGGGVGSGTYAMVINAPPITITSGPPPNGRVGEAYNFRFFAQGPPTGPQGFLWSVVAGTLPGGLTLATDGLLSGTPNTEGTFRFTVRAVAPNQNGAANAEYTLTIQPRGLAITGDPPAGAVNVTYSFTYTVSGGSPPYTFLLVSGTPPPGLSLNTNTGLLSGTPATAGSFTFTLAVLDRLQQRATRTSTVPITADLRLVTEALEDAVERVAYSATIQSAGGTAPLVYSLEGSLPPGLTLSAAGVLAGTPTAAGRSSFTIRVTDALRQSITRGYTLEVRPPLAITTATLDRAVRNETYSATIGATGGIPPYRFSAAAPPAGMALSAAGVLSGIPTAAGTASFTVQVLDQRNNRSERTYALVVSNRPVITTTVLPNGSSGADYSATLAGTGTGALSWSVSAGSLPAGLALNGDTGVISGRPTGGGTSNFTVQLTDTTQLTATRALSIAIALAIPAATITQVGDAVPAGQQPAFGITLGGPSPIDLRGTVTIAHTPERGPADPNVRFANGQTSMDFTIARGQATAASAVTNTPLAFQAGTVAGTIALTVVLRDAVSNAVLPPNPAARRTITINRAGPSITSVRINRTAAGIEVLVTGFSNTREVAGANFRFTAAPGSQLATADVNVPVQQAFQTWFESAASTATGAQFLLTMPFSVQGGGAGNLASVQVTLTNSVGNASGSASF